jgi:diaminopimelate decarboxylase
MTKPMGPIPAGYAADQDFMLLIGGRRADALVDEAGDTPLFVYDLALVDAKIAAFRKAFPGTDLHYAMKANSYGPLLRHVARKVDGLDIASAGEMDMALEAGAKAPRSASPGRASATRISATRSTKGSR